MSDEEQIEWLADDYWLGYQLSQTVEMLSEKKALTPEAYATLVVARL